MNKLKTLGILAVSVLCCSSAAFAQNNNKADGCPKTEMCAKKCKSADCKSKAEGCNKKSGCCMSAADKTNPMFEGITLSQEQKDKLAALKTKCMAEKAQQTCQKQCDKKFANRDSVAKAQKRAHLAEIKQILTPEQYVVFLENMAVNRPAGNPMHKQQMHRMAPKKNGKKHQSEMRIKGKGRQSADAAKAAE